MRSRDKKNSPVQYIYVLSLLRPSQSHEGKWLPPQHVVRIPLGEFGGQATWSTEFLGMASTRQLANFSLCKQCTSDVLKPNPPLLSSQLPFFGWINIEPLLAINPLPGTRLPFSISQVCCTTHSTEANLAVTPWQAPCPSALLFARDPKGRESQTDPSRTKSRPILNITRDPKRRGCMSSPRGHSTRKRPHRARKTAVSTVRPKKTAARGSAWLELSVTLCSWSDRVPPRDSAEHICVRCTARTTVGQAHTYDLGFAIISSTSTSTTI